MLHPMHSRMSSGRPSSIFFGRNGSAIDGRAHPTRSTRPLAHDRHHPVGRGVAPHRHHRLRRQLLHAVDERFVRAFVPEARGDRVVLPSPRAPGPTDRESRRGDRSRLPPRISPVRPRPRSSSMEIRHGTAHVSPTASRVSIRVSFSRRTRFSSDPPYSSVRRVEPAREEVVQVRQGVSGVDVDEVEAGATGAERRGAVPAADDRGCRASSSPAPGPDRR